MSEPPRTNLFVRCCNCPTFSADKIFQNKFEKPLDNQHKMCYNNKAMRDRNPLLNKMGGEPTANMKGVYMTNREFFVNVSKGIVTEGEMAHATEQIAKMDAANAKRAETQSKKSKENVPLKMAIRDLLIAKGGMTSPDIAVALNEQGITTAEGEPVSTSKASSMCRQMVEEGWLSVEEIKVPKKGKLKQYTAIMVDTE